MKNKYELKKYLKITVFFIIFLTILFIFLEYQEYKKYNYNLNIKITSLINNLRKKYPLLTEEEIISILKENDESNEFIKKYSIDIKNDTILENNKKISKKFLIVKISFFIFSLSIIVILFFKYNQKKDKAILNLTKTVEKINKKNYSLDLDEYTEDDLSILKSEIYKTTIMLKETAENASNDKIMLKDSLSNISHQLKTPLTSIMIMLDNLLDNPSMDEKKRLEFIKDIKIEINNINFLVQAILKLSKFDANTVEFINKEIKLSNLIDLSIKKLLPLSDLKNVKLNVKIIKDDIINCDQMWQIEALSNIIKNSIEHSKNDSEVDITITSNSVYSQIEIKDFGFGISKNDLPNIFERFYKGENSSANSIGIGLALAKTIINKNNGAIYVTSELNKYTIFKIKYYK